MRGTLGAVQLMGSCGSPPWPTCVLQRTPTFHQAHRRSQSPHSRPGHSAITSFSAPWLALTPCPSPRHSTSAAALPATLTRRAPPLLAGRCSMSQLIRVSVGPGDGLAAPLDRGRRCPKAACLPPPPRGRSVAAGGTAGGSGSCLCSSCLCSSPLAACPCVLLHSLSCRACSPWRACASGWWMPRGRWWAAWPRR